MNSPVKEFSIIDKDKNGNIFNTSDEYVIPLYQRAYAWEDKQLLQLIEDINDIADDVGNYYIGSLIVSKQNDRYEVVDGQQRLTSLYLLLNCLEIKTNLTLSFACREKSNYTLRNIKELISENYNKLDMDRIEPGIQRGIKILSRELKRLDRDTFIKKLSKVKIYRIEVPQNTDLNRYFEIMNTRGEQLEHHDILKAKLMSYLKDESERVLFAKIWDACSDMTGYVQMHFVSKNNIVRKSIFGSEWNSMPSNDWEEYKKVIDGATKERTGHCIPALIVENFKVEDDEGYIDNDTRVRFESIIDFPYFLLHTLKVYININHITHEKDNKIVDELLDDKKLLDAFKKVIEEGSFDGQKISNKKEDFARNFIMCLLRTRFLFDKYIIKREYINDSADGEWSLKSLHVSGQQSQKKSYYKNSKFTKQNEWGSTNDYRVKTNIMIQSALRVSYTSPKVMHWITELLIWLSESNCEHTKEEHITDFYKFSEKIASTAVNKNFFNVCKDGQYAMGVNTPHIVFNYLDYLLWKKDTKKYDDFEFEFRNSVEHWYPQNPSKDSFESWDRVDMFGNLCIIQSNINSRFSNMSPEAKKSTFKDKIAKGSIKLRIMSELTKDNNWKDKCSKHGNDMIETLRKACNAQKN